MENMHPEVDECMLAGTRSDGNHLFTRKSKEKQVLEEEGGVKEQSG
jgi:hypothetical protein